MIMCDCLSTLQTVRHRNYNYTQRSVPMGETQDTAGVLQLHKVKQHIFIKVETKLSGRDNFDRLSGMCLCAYLNLLLRSIAVLSLHEVAAVI